MTTSHRVHRARSTKLPFWNAVGRVWLAAAVLVAAGCDALEPPAFRTNQLQLEACEIAPAYQREISQTLTALFGTPDHPSVPAATDLDQALLNLAAGAPGSDLQGANYGLYRKHCAQCHGVTGDGRGPTARFQNPYPRDYRPGVFKFKSTHHSAQPTDDDLRRVLRQGVPGTAMPAFSLPATELAALVEYVKYLSIRGQLETALIRYVQDELGEEAPADQAGDATRVPLDPATHHAQHETVLQILAEDVMAGWRAAPQLIVLPAPAEVPAEDRAEILAAVAAGRELFYGTRANCARCHDPEDGSRPVERDYWNQAHQDFLDDLAALASSIEKRRLSPGGRDQAWQADLLRLSRGQTVAASLYPVRQVLPRDLSLGTYRGGHRRIDIFRRISAGIAGTPMPSCGPTSSGAPGALTETEIWQLVDYVLSLPAEKN